VLAYTVLVYNRFPIRIAVIVPMTINIIDIFLVNRIKRIEYWKVYNINWAQCLEMEWFLDSLPISFDTFLTNVTNVFLDSLIKNVGEVAEDVIYIRCPLLVRQLNCHYCLSACVIRMSRPE
jgi:hypothetical protein